MFTKYNTILLSKYDKYRRKIVRELYVKGFINKEVYQKETRFLFELATEYGA